MILYFKKPKKIKLKYIYFTKNVTVMFKRPNYKFQSQKLIYWSASQAHNPQNVYSF